MRDGEEKVREMTIGPFARRAGVSVDTARFYERVGLLQPRRQHNYRLYGGPELERMGFIVRARASGFSLSEIEGFVQLLTEGKRSCLDFADAARQKLSDLEERIAALQAARRALKRALSTCAPAAGECMFVPPA